MASSYTPTTQTNKFEEWYKSHYGGDYNSSAKSALTRKDGMSDVDWDIGQKLYHYYTAENNASADYKSSVTGANEQHSAGLSELERYYGGAQAELSKNKEASTKQANRTYELMKKYIPEQLRENGLGGSGFGETAMLGAYTTHENNLTAIDNSYQESSAALAGEKASEKLKLDTDRNSTLRELERAYLQGKSEREVGASDAVSDIAKYYRDEARENESTVFEDEAYNLDFKFEKMKKESSDGMLSSGQYEELEAYVNELESSGVLTANNVQRLRSRLEHYKDYISENSITKKEMKLTLDNGNEVNVGLHNEVVLDGEANDAEDGAGDNFSLKIGDKSYDVEVGDSYITGENGKRITDLYKQAYGTSPLYGNVIVVDGKAYAYLRGLTTNEIGSYQIKDGRLYREDGWFEIRGQYWDKGGYNSLINALGE